VAAGPSILTSLGPKTGSAGPAGAAAEAAAGATGALI